MKRKRTLLPVLAAALVLGLVTAATLAGTGVASGLTDTGGTDTTPAATTVDPGTTTDPGTTDPGTTDTATTDPGTTDPGTTDTGTTDPATTTDPGPADTGTTDTGTTPASTGGDTVSTPVSGGDTATVGQGSDQGNVQVPGSSGSGSSSDCSPGPGSSCGNNAATQIAVVNQVCSASGSTTLTLTISDPNGGNRHDVTVEAPVECNNVVQITQVVRQYCVNCTLVVNQYHLTQNTTSTSTTVVSAPAFTAYCMPKDRPIMRGDGTVGWLVFLAPGQAASDPLYRGAAPAQYDGTQGFVCPWAAPAALPATFTLTVPSSLIGQYINLCIQPSTAGAKQVCHSIKIDNAATVTIPVTANMTATVTPKPKAKDASAGAIAGASKGYLPKPKVVCKTAVKNGKKVKSCHPVKTPKKKAKR